MLRRMIKDLKNKCSTRQIVFTNRLWNTQLTKDILKVINVPLL